MEIIGRQREQKILQRCLESKKPEFIAVYGRRRVGKTYLIREYFTNRIVFSMTGTPKASQKAQLEGFDDALQDAGGEVQVPTQNWNQAFKLLRLLLKQRISDPQRNGKLVVFIDELPWLATQRSGFVQALEHFWNSWASSRPELILVVCGSATSWIINNLIHEHGGLHNRVTRQLRLEPFSLCECEQYLEYLGLAYTHQQIAELYMVTGGIPYYLDYLEPGKSVAQNIDAMFFAVGAPLLHEFDDLYASLFKNPGHHIAVVATLAAHKSGLTQSELAKSAKIKAGGTLSKTLQELEQCGFIVKQNDFMSKRIQYYRLVDFYTWFYFKHVKAVNAQEHNYWQARSRKGELLSWNGLAFERLCEAHLAQIKQRLGIAGISVKTSAWRSRESRPAVQIDMIISREDGIINLCEMKFSDAPYAIGAKEAEDLSYKLSVFASETRTRKALHLTMVASQGLSSGSYRGDIQSVITLSDLFMPLLTL
ncbi:MAG: AAA family ATPase [Coriobacteriales bacterium]|jgi:hypothetical protein|nr:AAA family ATPase [Coriobacteriales bacterium]